MILLEIKEEGDGEYMDIDNQTRVVEDLQSPSESKVAVKSVKSIKIEESQNFEQPVVVAMAIRPFPS